MSLTVSDSISSPVVAMAQVLVQPLGPIDADGDGFAANGLPLDCNDTDASISPGATERCFNEVDDDCDGQTDEDAPEGGLAACPGDVDQDGVPNPTDNCISIANSDQQDSDSDSVGDLCDLCPTTSDPTNTAVCGCVPACGGKVCGDDGCGGSCGACGGVNSCNVESCVEGQCASVPVASGTICDDGNVCTNGDVCAAGLCSGSVVACDDGSPCTVDTCTASTGCVHTQVPGCDIDGDGDGVYDATDNCTQVANPDQKDTDSDSLGDACDLCPTTPDPTNTTVCGCVPACAGKQCGGDGCGGSCGTCGGGNSCNVESCVQGQCASVPKADGTICDDGSVCTNSDVCAAGLCSGSFVICDDGNPCTADTCSASTGCVSTPIPGACATDGDNDGVDDATDNCKQKPNPDQQDADADSVGDACDLCPDMADPTNSGSPRFHLIADGLRSARI